MTTPVEVQPDRRDPLLRIGMLVLLIYSVVQIIAAAVLISTLRGPFHQLEELTRINRDIVAATCDSSFYTPDELKRRTPMQQRRLAIVCHSRRQLDSTLSIPPPPTVDTTRVDTSNQEKKP